MTRERPVVAANGAKIFAPDTDTLCAISRRMAGWK